MSSSGIVFLLVYFGALTWCSVICVKKGKTTMMIMGWIFFSPLIVIGACRIAKPDSSWAARYTFSPMKQFYSIIRFPKEAAIQQRRMDALVAAMKGES